MKCENGRAETLIWEADTQKPSRSMTPSHPLSHEESYTASPKPMRSFTIRMELLWVPTTRPMSTQTHSGSCPFSTYRQSPVLNFPVSCEEAQKAGRVLMVVALARCCTVALQSGKKEHHPRNNLAIQMQDLLPKCPWKQGYSAIRNARSTGLKGWAEKGDPGSILEIWTLSI